MDNIHNSNSPPDNPLEVSKERDVFGLFLYLLKKEKDEFTVSAEEQLTNYYKILERINGT
ncbi:MAG: hypothetical protein K6F55_11015 [Eubacterium sp.]|nr:hypothetical protein [Eubacterium sp.]